MLRPYRFSRIHATIRPLQTPKLSRKAIVEPLIVAGMSKHILNNLSVCRHYPHGMDMSVQPVFRADGALQAFVAPRLTEVVAICFETSS